MKSILLVDDEQESIDVFKSALETSGNTVDIGKSAKEALEKCKTSKFDIIILDEMMPDMSGNELIKILKSDDTTKQIPILILTNYSDDNLVKTALSSGATDYVLKYNTVPEDLVQKVIGILGE